MTGAFALMISLATLVLMVFVAHAAEPVKLVYVPYYDGPRQEIEQEIVRRFNESHPNIQVEISGLTGKSIDEIITYLAAGEQIDVGSFHQNLAGLLYGGYTLDLTPYIERDNFDTGIFRPGTMPSVTYSGRILGFPFGTGAEFPYINATLFDEAGMSTPTKGWTLADLQAMLPKLTRTDGTGNVTQWALGMNSYLQGWAPFFLADGGQFVNEMGEIDLLRSPVPEMMDWTANLIRQNEGAQWGWAGPWREGRMAIVIDWEGRVPQHFAEGLHDKFKWFLTYMPLGKAGSLLVYSTHTTVILKATAHPEEAWTFLRYFVEEGDALFGQNFLYPATINGARALLELSETSLPHGLDLQSFYGAVLEPPEKGIVYPAHIPGWPDVYSLLEQALAPVRSGEKPAAVALAEVLPAAQEALRRGAEEAVYKW